MGTRRSRAHQRVRVKRRTRGEGGATGNERAGQVVASGRAGGRRRDRTGRDMARVDGGGS